MNTEQFRLKLSCVIAVAGRFKRKTNEKLFRKIKRKRKSERKEEEKREHTTHLRKAEVDTRKSLRIQYVWKMPKKNSGCIQFRTKERQFST